MTTAWAVRRWVCSASALTIRPRATSVCSNISCATTISQRAPSPSFWLIVLIATGEPRRLTRDSQAEEQPLFSPGGKRVAFAEAALHDAAGRLCATASSTLLLFDIEPRERGALLG